MRSLNFIQMDPSFSNSSKSLFPEISDLLSANSRKLPEILYTNSINFSTPFNVITNN